ncbi:MULTISPECIES: GntR family transcriptional regulator [unclassified Sporosarcina]|uniref:GntR family transcriptional regulator n=1 Tax=unclassified Sporosarcina TaxID=2647733 RepID=UPI0020403EA3|nr:MULTISPECIES: GntR family transcriptional regulator [unclassified Sporosarcina]GKV63849.1 putative HTH-type transcriptional regulator YhcF [Sporosarcina sp. NCCP-2331]GLB54628.1 putative HTH-type transcriptional regulator YhcF [Sporosarcina sp. NCCP-2378]
MSMEFLPDKPIYQQLVDHIIGEIIRGALATGEKLPSVRDYAVSVGVNANTMQRVYKELEQMKITETRRGQGSFVTDNIERIQELREEMKEQQVQSFIQNVEALGFTTHEMVSYLQKRGGSDD